MRLEEVRSYWPTLEFPNETLFFDDFILGRYLRVANWSAFPGLQHRSVSSYSKIRRHVGDFSVQLARAISFRGR